MAEAGAIWNRTEAGAGRVAARAHSPGFDSCSSIPSAVLTEAARSTGAGRSTAMAHSSLVIKAAATASSSDAASFENCPCSGSG